MSIPNNGQEIKAWVAIVLVCQRPLLIVQVVLRLSKSKTVRRHIIQQLYLLGQIPPKKIFVVSIPYFATIKLSENFTAPTIRSFLKIFISL